MMTKSRHEELLEAIAALNKRLDHVTRLANETRQLVGPFAAPFPDGSLLTQTIHGLKYFIDPHDMIIAPQIVVYRQWEADISQLFRSLCRPDSVVVDIGANFGYFSVLAANLIGPRGTGQVISFEPNPSLCALLRRNRVINWSIAPVTLHEIALGEREDELILHVPTEGGANGSLSAPRGADCTQIPVSVKRLDDMLPPDLAVDVIKIDVEGHEATVLRGAREVIARSPTLHLILEWSRKQMALAGLIPEDVLAALKGFVPHQIVLGSGALDHPKTIDWLMAQEYTNVLFARR
jgi:FkbM family methyltransferase